jgi:glycosyltransferase involved in cell wall biosynthesis
MKEKRYKISFLLPSLGGGGAEKVVVNLVNELCKDEKIAVDLVLGNAVGDYIELVNNKVNIIDLEAPRMYKSILKLKNYLKKNSPDILISGIDYVNVIALLARKLSGVKTKIFVTEHNTLSQIMKNNKSIKTSILVNAMKIFYKEADKIIAVSHGVATDLSDILGLKKDAIQVIYNPVINENIIKKSYEEVSHNWLNNTDSQSQVLLAIGRLTQQKDFLTLIEAFNLLKDDNNAKLIILGEGEMRNTLQSKIDSLNLTDRIVLQGFSDNPYAFMRKIDLFVLSSKWEGLPTVLIEALACGAQVVSTDCKSGPREILNNGQFGSLVPVGDIEGLATEIQKKLQRVDSPSENSELKDWLQQFESTEVMRKYKNLIEQNLQ